MCPLLGGSHVSSIVKIPSPLKVVQVITKINRINSKSEDLGGPAVCGYHRNRVRSHLRTSNMEENVLTRQFCLKRTLLLDRLAGFVVSLTRPSHSQERVWYFTVQLIVLAYSGCRVYTQLHSTQTTYIWGEAPHESRGVWNKPLQCKVPDSFLRKGVASKTMHCPRLIKLCLGRVYRVTCDRVPGPLKTKLKRGPGGTRLHALYKW